MRGRRAARAHPARPRPCPTSPAPRLSCSVSVPGRNLSSLTSLPPRVFRLTPTVRTTGLDLVNVNTGADEIVYAIIGAVSTN